jgi:hypothetical protein
VDTGRLRTGFGYAPRFSTEEALASYLAGRPTLPRLGAGALRLLAGLAERVLTSGPAPALPIPAAGTG